jgi:hypothetical protein
MHRIGAFGVVLALLSGARYDHCTRTPRRDRSTAMIPSTPPLAAGDDAVAPTLDADPAIRPDLPAPGHPTVFLDDGPTLEYPAAE